LAPNVPPKILEEPTGGGRGRRAAWGFVLSNLVLPGLGTFAARHRLEGALQLVVSQTGFVLMMVWTTSFVRMWKRQGSLPEDFGPHAGLCALGLALFFLAWIWSLASSYGILQDSRTSGL
jgi:hypothetical protein